ncbi:MAG: efflux RND transporter periplasmic adaptor subunit [Flavobacteriaceae bacterium]|jgi:RND family efflux transporter MFP subunit|nr:efflux RND transporter periplasmic adaptor subunit [Flavobacteriaceae bacterium]
MKKLVSLSLIVLFAACGGNQNNSIDLLIEQGDVAALKAAKESINSQQVALASDLNRIEAALTSLSPEKNLPLVTVEELQSQKFEHYVELQGNITTKENIIIAAEVAGTLDKIHVKKGDWVAQGALLAEINAGGLDHQLEQLRVSAALAKTTFERQSRLWEQKIGSEIQYLQAKTQYEAQQNAFERMEKMLAKTKITAPFAGIVDQVLADPGSLVAPGMGGQLFRLINLSNMYVTVDVPERYITSVKKGNAATVHIDVLGKSVATTIRETGNYIAPSNRSFEVELAVPNKDRSIKPNLNARVAINDYSNDAAILIPQSVISENAAGQQYVYVMTDATNGVGTAKRRIVTTGQASDQKIEILSGLAPGDVIVIEGARRLKDGQRIKTIG